MKEQSVLWVKGSLFSVQLIYSDASGLEGKESLWEIYCAALFPFMYNVPAVQVEFVLASRFLNYAESVIDNVAKSANENQVGPVKFLPSGYNDYFKAVYKAAKHVADVDLLSSPCSVRIISGQGFGGVGGGHIKCGKASIPFNEIGPIASVVTILDICNSAHAIAAFSKTYPDDPKVFTGIYKKQIVFSDPPAFPVACDAFRSVWAFRIGEPKQSLKRNYDLETDLPLMSIPLGDAVTASLLAASFDYVVQGKKGSLDGLYIKKYTSLNTVYLGNPKHKLIPYCHLQALQDLLHGWHLTLNLDAFECQMFARQTEWFLTTERMMKLSLDQIELAQDISQYIVDWVCDWHKRNRLASQALPEAESTWLKIVDVMGPFSSLLNSIFLIQNEESGVVKESTEEEGVPLEEWATSCVSLGRCFHAVCMKILSNSFTYTDEE